MGKIKPGDSSQKISTCINAEKMLPHILAKVEKPARYTGGEYNQVVKNTDNIDVRVALCFPDIYEIGMSNLGIRILYGILNGMDGVWCERVFAPWTDMEGQMRESGVSLYGLESYDAIKNFDIIAFSIGYELSYTNVLNMLDIAGLKCRSADRDDNAPVVIAGGTCCFNPQPLVDFIDLFVIGEGEEVIAELIGLYKDLYKNNRVKHTFLQEASKLEGIYVPSVHNTEYQPARNAGHNTEYQPAHNAGDNTEYQPARNAGHISEYVKIKKRIVENLDSAYFPVKSIVPSIDIVHNRAVLELFRGCKRGCKFCQAGHIYSPLRMRSPEILAAQAKESIKNSGYDEIALLSLSTSDYKYLDELCENLLGWCTPRKINLSLPSLRADNFSIELMKRVQKVRKSGLTFAPEAGTQRLRDYINKKITEEDVMEACRAAFDGGWNTVKLYFMLGLPTETDEDVIGIAQMAHRLLGVWKNCENSKKRGVRITVSTSCFIPKPHTPFEREAQIPINEYLRRVQLLKSNIKSKKITYNWHSPEQGFIEAVLSRGDRQIGKVIESAWKQGARFDAWSEHFKLDTWMDAFMQCSINPNDYTDAITENETLPWGFIER